MLDDTHRGNGKGSRPFFTLPSEGEKRLGQRLDFSLAAALFILAFIPRALDLATFLTIDEPNWIARSARFLHALLSGNLSGTFQTNHPGVITMWTGSLGLAVYHQLHPTTGSLTDFLTQAIGASPAPEILPYLRMPTAVLSAASVAILYLLIRRTFVRSVALLAGILVALDPFFLAHSRVLHHDALSTLFMTVAFLSLATYLVAERWLGYAAISGTTAALAGLSKVSSLFLGPFTIACFILASLPALFNRTNRRAALMELLRGLATWLGAGAVTFYVLWPAMWLEPISTVHRLLTGTADLVEAGHHQFFLGRIVTDAGAAFYPVILLFRTTRLSFLGLVLAVIFLVLACVNYPNRRTRPFFETNRQTLLILVLCVCYIVSFVAFITVSPKKQDRYLLPVFPIVDLLAAFGLLSLVHTVVSVGRRARVEAAYRRVSTLVIGVCLVLMLGLAAAFHPYYLSYYNPLAGGSAVAQEQLLIGWGEGMDLVARYLNMKEHAEALTVAAVPAPMLAPFFRGTTTDYITNTAPALAADYIVTYINNVQRRGPDLALWQYLQSRRPEAVFQLHGIDYAWLYPGLGYLTYSEPQMTHRLGARFAGKLQLLGYDYELRPGTLSLTLFWQALLPMTEDYSVSVRLLDVSRHRWAQVDGPLVHGLLPTHEFAPGWIARDERTITLPPGTPGGDYSVEVVVYLPSSNQPLPVVTRQGVSSGLALDAGKVKLLTHPARRDEVHPGQGLDVSFGPWKIIGFDPLSTAVRPGAQIPIRLYWERIASLGTATPIRLTLLDKTGQILAEVEHKLDAPALAPGDVLIDWADIAVPADIASGTYYLQVNGNERRAVDLGTVQVEGRAHHFNSPTPRVTGLVDFNGCIRWLGYDLAGTAIRSGQPIRLTLYWQALAMMQENYKMFVHLIGQDGRLWGQRDVVPKEGTAPTTSWLPGEVLSETLEITLAPNAPAGHYDLVFGWYNEATGTRLPLADGNGDHVSVSSLVTYRP